MKPITKLQGEVNNKFQGIIDMGQLIYITFFKQIQQNSPVIKNKKSSNIIISLQKSLYQQNPIIIIIKKQPPPISMDKPISYINLDQIKFVKNLTFQGEFPKQVRIQEIRRIRIYRDKEKDKEMLDKLINQLNLQANQQYGENVSLYLVQKSKGFDIVCQEYINGCQVKVSYRASRPYIYYVLNQVFSCYHHRHYKETIEFINKPPKPQQSQPIQKKPRQLPAPKYLPLSQTIRVQPTQDPQAQHKKKLKQQALTPQNICFFGYHPTLQQTKQIIRIQCEYHSIQKNFISLVDSLNEKSRIVYGKDKIKWSYHRNSNTRIYVQCIRTYCKAKLIYLKDNQQKCYYLDKVMNQHVHYKNSMRDIHLKNKEKREREREIQREKAKEEKQKEKYKSIVEKDKDKELVFIVDDQYKKSNWKNMEDELTVQMLLNSRFIS